MCRTRSHPLGRHRSTCRGECSWSGPLVTPSGRCHRGLLTNGPGCIPPCCVCSGGADTVTGGAPKPLRLGPSPASPVGLFRHAPPLAVWFAVVGFPSLPGGVVVGGGFFRFSWPCCLCACPHPPWLWFAVGVCVCGAVRARVVSVLVCVSCLRGGVGVGVPSMCVGVCVCVCGCVVGAGWGLLLMWLCYHPLYREYTSSNVISDDEQPENVAKELFRLAETTAHTAKGMGAQEPQHQVQAPAPATYSEKVQDSVPEGTHENTEGSHPPHPGRPGHSTRGTPPQATRKRDRGRRARKGGGGGTNHQQTPARGGGEPHSRDGRGAKTHSPHTHTELPNQAQKGEDRHPNAPPTHRTHARACTQHTPPQPPPTRAPQTHTTHQSASTARTTNATHANPKNKNPATPRQGSCRAARNTASTQRWTHQALSQEWRAATPSNTQPTTPKPRTRHYDTHTSTATNTQTRRHNTLTSGNTRNQWRHRRQHQRPQHPAQHLRHPHQQQTNTKSHPTLTNDRTRAPHRPAPRTTATSIHTIGNTNTTNNQASTTPSPTSSPPALSPTKRKQTNTGYSTYITQANGIKHTIAGITPPSASPPATSATKGNQSHHSR